MALGGGNSNLGPFIEQLHLFSFPWGFPYAADVTEHF